MPGRKCQAWAGGGRWEVGAADWSAPLSPERASEGGSVVLLLVDLGRWSASPPQRPHVDLGAGV